MQTDAKIYVAGHTGLAGAAIVRGLQAHGYTNIITRRHSELDLLNERAVRDFFAAEQPEYVVFAAAKVGGIKANLAEPAEFLYVNLQMQTNVIWAAHEANVKKFLFLGSSCIYPRLAPQPMKEECLLTGPVEPTNEGYALAKIAGLKLCEKIYEQYGQCFISCMPPNLYGPEDHFDPERSHVLQGLMARLHRAKVANEPECVVWGTGQTRREFLWTDDLAEAVIWMLENYDQKEFLNVGSGQDVAIIDLARMIADVVGYVGELRTDPSKPDGMPQKLLDVSRAHSLGWRHTTDLSTGLVRLYQEFLKRYA